MSIHGAAEHFLGTIHEQAWHNLTAILAGFAVAAAATVFLVVLAVALAAVSKWALDHLPTWGALLVIAGEALALFTGVAYLLAWGTMA